VRQQGKERKELPVQGGLPAAWNLLRMHRVPQEKQAMADHGLHEE